VLGVNKSLVFLVFKEVSPQIHPKLAFHDMLSTNRTTE
jgi:hypothetical protein